MRITHIQNKKKETYLNRTTTTKQEQPVCKGRNITSSEFQKLIKNERNNISKNKHQKFASTYRNRVKAKTQKLKISYHK